MATLVNSIELYDNATPILTNIENVMMGLTKTVKNLGNAINSNIKPSVFIDVSNNMNIANTSIINATQSQNEFNKKVDEGKKKTSKLGEFMKKLVSKSNLERGAKAFVKAADTYANSMAKLNSINDGLQTTEQLNKKILNSANRAKTNYNDMIGTVSKLGTTASSSFGSNDEMIVFTELMTKSFKTAGASASDQKKGMDAVVQAMAKGRLEGAGLNSVLQNAPVLAQSIANEMGVSMDQLQKMGKDGKITSDILKVSMFNSADKINDKFAEVPTKFSDIITLIKNDVLGNLQPAFSNFIAFINSPQGQQLFSGLSMGINNIVLGISWLLSMVMTIGSLFIDNWSVIAPLLLGIFTAITLLKGATLAMNIISAIGNGIRALTTASIIAATNAQLGLNSALLTCPLVWILLIIIAVIAVIFMVVAVINRVTGSTLSATGIIMGALSAALAFVGNLFLGIGELILGVIGYLVNPFINIANFVANVFTNPISSVIYLFQGMADTVLGIIEKIASGLDFIFQTDMSSTVAGWRTDLKAKADEMVKKHAPEENYEQKIDNLDLSMRDFGVTGTSYVDSYKSGYKMGDGMQKSMDDLFKTDKVKDDLDIERFKNPSDYSSVDKVNRVNTVGGIEEDVDISSQDLELMRDLAEMKAIHNYVTLTPSVKVTTGDLHKEVDVDMVVGKITRALDEEISVNAKGVYTIE